MISVAAKREDRSKSFLRLGSKSLSLGGFVFGTATFAAARLIALHVAVLVMTLILAAALFARGIAGWIVAGVNKTEPRIHVIVDTTQEAQRLIDRILSLDECGSQVTGENQHRKVHMELAGHVFVKQHRVGSRSCWHLWLLGVLAEPFDLRGVDQSRHHHRAASGGRGNSEIELGLLRADISRQHGWLFVQLSIDCGVHEGRIH